LKNIHYNLLPISMIEALQTPAYGTIRKKGWIIDGVDGKMEKSDKGFAISWRDHYSIKQRRQFKLGRTIGQIGFKVNAFDLLMLDMPIRSHRTTLDDGPVVSAHCGYFKTNGLRLSRPYYYRLVIPLERWLNTHYQIAASDYSSDIVPRATHGTAGTIEGDSLQACFEEHDSRHYLVIDSGMKQGFDLFAAKAYALKNAIGYLTGHLAGDAGYYFAYSKSDRKEPIHFCFNEWRNTIISGLTPINANALAYHQNSSTLRLHEKKLLRPLTLTEFSSLCQQLYDSKPFTGIVILILEGSIASLVLMPGAFAIALESMAELITDPLKEKIAPIKDKSLARRIRAACSEIVRTNCDGLAADDLKALLGRIEHINDVTNQSRLRVPFKLLNIELTASDFKTIDTRNKFLHGTVPDMTEVGEVRSERREDLDRYYAALRLYTLLNRLILKWAGYGNYLINHAKIQEEATGVKLKEPYYIKD